MLLITRMLLDDVSQCEIDLHKLHCFRTNYLATII